MFHSVRFILFMCTRMCSHKVFHICFVAACYLTYCSTSFRALITYPQHVSALHECERVSNAVRVQGTELCSPTARFFFYWASSKRCKRLRRFCSAFIASLFWRELHAKAINLFSLHEKWTLSLNVWCETRKLCNEPEVNGHSLALTHTEKEMCRCYVDSIRFRFSEVGGGG